VPILFTNNWLQTWHARIETRLVVLLPAAMWVSVLGYQTYGAAVGYFCAWGVWWVGFVEGEVCYVELVGEMCDCVRRADFECSRRLCRGSRGMLGRRLEGEGGVMVERGRMERRRCMVW